MEETEGSRNQIQEFRATGLSVIDLGFPQESSGSLPSTPVSSRSAYSLNSPGPLWTRRPRDPVVLPNNRYRLYFCESSLLQPEGNRSVLP